MQLVIGPAGSVRCLYGEMIDLRMLGRIAITRASHVEPDEDGCWRADLAPVQGPVLGPYPSRSAALAAESKWLEQHLTSEGLPIALPPPVPRAPLAG